MYLIFIGTYSIPCKLTATLFTNDTSTAMGITAVYATLSGPTTFWSSWSYVTTVAYWVVSLLLNVLLTLMIVIKLVMHTKNIRRAMGASFEGSGLYKSIISMLIESCTLYASAFLAYIITWNIGDPNTYTSSIFQLILGETQVRAALMGNLRAVRLIIWTGRSSLRSSSFSGLPTGRP